MKAYRPWRDYPKSYLVSTSKTIVPTRFWLPASILTNHGLIVPSAKIGLCSEEQAKEIADKDRKAGGDPHIYGIRVRVVVS